MPNYKMRECQECGKGFQPWSPRGAYCSIRCKLKSEALIDRRNGCWIWVGHVDGPGYGLFGWRGRRIKTHRAAYEIWNGPIPEGAGYHGICVLHACDNRRCINPDHLWLGTHDDNMEDMNIKGRQIAPVGENHGWAKLTDDQVRQIRGANGPHWKIAESFGVSRSLIGMIRRREIWRHV